MAGRGKSKEFVSDSSDSEGEPKQKKAKKKEKKEESATDDDVPPFEIGGKKKVSINHFKGRMLIDIREFYDADGVEKPGRRGISLSEEQWQNFKKIIPKIDKELKK